MGVLFLTTVLPAGRRGGGEIVSQSVIEALSDSGHHVRVLGYCRPGVAAAEWPREVCIGNRPIETASAGWRSLAWMARAVAARAPYSSVKYNSGAYVRAAGQAVASNPSAMIVDHAQMHFAVRSMRGQLPPLVFLAHNAEGEMYSQLGRTASNLGSRWANRREGRRIRAVEADLARRAQQVWVLTEADAEYFHALSPEADVRVLEVASLMGEGRPVKKPDYDVALVGSWSWDANGRGLEWFANEVVPHLPAGMSVEVGGAGAEWLEGRFPNVTVRGFVDCAESFMARAGVVAVPSITGGGVQVKTLDAIACGVPVVATCTATRGLADLPASVAETDSPEEFAGHLVRLAASPERKRLRKDAIAWSRARREALDTSIARFIEELAPAREELRQPLPARVSPSEPLAA